MIKTAIYYYLLSILFLLITGGICPVLSQSIPEYQASVQNLPADRQLLLNGRIWHNQYLKAFDDQFFLSNTFLKGSVTFNGRKYDNLDLLYDIANDELILGAETYPIIIMNKEMVDSFSLITRNRIYNFINGISDTANVLNGYLNVLYNGPTTLYVRYFKKLLPMAVDGRYDLFYQEHDIYLKIGNQITRITGKKKLLNLLEDKKREIRYFLKSKRLKLLQNNPETYVPVLKHYDSIKE